jgi:hypothetical protein
MRSLTPGARAHGATPLHALADPRRKNATRRRPWSQDRYDELEVLVDQQAPRVPRMLKNEEVHARCLEVREIGGDPS